MNFPVSIYGQPPLDTTEYDFMPVPMFVPIQSGYNSGNQMCTPYSQDLRQTAARLKLTIPFKEVITMDQGHSHCNQCGAKYAGHNPSLCDRKIFKIKRGYNWELSNRCAEDPKDNRYEACGGSSNWSLIKEFHEQVRFFSFVQELSQISHDNFDEFSDCIPVELRDAMRTKLTAARLLNLEVKVQNALYQISSRMSQAGQALQF